MADSRSRWLLLAHRVLLRLAPRRDRERFGQETEDAFRDLVRDTRATRGRAAAAGVAVAALLDLVRSSARQRGAGWRQGLLSGVLTDLRHSSRVFCREPLLSGGIALILTLVVGPAAAIGAVLYQIVLSPLPYPNPDQLVVLQYRTSYGAEEYFPPSAVSDYRDVPGFSNIGGAMTNYTMTAVLSGQPVRVRAVRASAGFLATLGVPFAAGRDKRVGEQEAVVTNAFALAYFGSEQGAIGQLLQSPSGGTVYTIVGVLASQMPLPGPPGRDAFIPQPSVDTPAPRRTGGQARVIARLKPDVTPAVALEQVKAIAATARATHGDPEVRPELVPLREAITGPMRLVLFSMVAIVLVVSTIAIASLASLVLARAVSRSGDVAVRVSLGATRWRVVRQWITDGLALAAPGVLAGAGLGALLLQSLRSGLVARVIAVPDPAAAGQAVTLVAVGLAAITVALFAMAPVAGGLLRGPLLSLKDASRSFVSIRRVRSQSLLVLVQVAASLALVISAAWLSASMWRLLALPLGVETDGLVTISVERMVRHPMTVEMASARRILAQLEQLAGPAGTAAVSSSIPGLGRPSFSPGRIRPDDPPFTENNRVTLAEYDVSTGYFDALGIRLLGGRTFASHDEASPDRVIVVSRSFAARWFPAGAVGQIVSFTDGDHREVVGVVEDVHAATIGQESYPQVYKPVTGALSVPSKYLLRSERPIDAIRADVAPIFRELDQAATVTVQYADDAVATPLVFRRITLYLIAGLGAIALLLALVNVYALSAFAVAQRTREIGIRVALGASATDAMRLVMRRGLLWSAMGLVVGAALAWFVAAPLAGAHLFQTRPWDPGPVVAALAMVGGVVVIASWLPARRAARIDPAITLKAE